MKSTVGTLVDAEPRPAHISHTHTLLYDAVCSYYYCCYYYYYRLYTKCHFDSNDILGTKDAYNTSKNAHTATALSITPQKS